MLRNRLRACVLLALGLGASAVGRTEEPPVPKPAPALRELWLGTLDAGGAKLRISLRLKRAADGTLSATVDSIDQGAVGLAVDHVAVQDGELRFAMDKLSAQFEGTLNEAGTIATGTWKQGGASLPLALEAVDKLPELRRPQEPSGPLPYLAEEVRYESKAAGVTLAGTLTLPKAGAPFPAVLLITGSGAEDRDETVFGHRPFLVLADHLTRQGIAVLRVDDRGVGGSSAGPADATTEDLASDVLAGVAFLKGRKEVSRIGLVGHSEGGLIAPIVAGRSADVAFLVLLGAPGVPGERILEEQTRLILKAEGAPDELITEATTINAKIYAILKEEKDPAALRRRVRELLAESAGMPEDVLETQLQAATSAWLRFFVGYDPRPALARVHVPLLALGGELDLQVPASENLEAIRTTLEAAEHQDHTVRALPGLNHLFQPARTGSPSEYPSIEQTFAPDALNAISAWILSHTTKVASR
ncbi:MAG TPA: alpha/beta hydrolase [Candidatus Polarisedimenticolaceae bacterium]|nr:alpha/beta hydrolase [Candidatus Polarisedimenticolaceae bacterium]